MPVYSPQAMADKTRYLINQGLPQAEAEAKAFAELGIYGDLPQDVRSAYEHYMTNPSANSAALSALIPGKSIAQQYRNGSMPSEPPSEVAPEAR